MLNDLKVALIGAGQMGGALLKGIVDSRKLSPHNIIVSEPRQERSEQLQRDFGIKLAKSNMAAVEECDVIVLAIKPCFQ